MKYCVCTDIDGIDQLKKLGFDGVELSGAMVTEMPNEEWEAFSREIAEKSVFCTGMNAALPPRIKICGPGFNPEVISEYATQLCRRLHVLRGNTVGIGSPKSRILPEDFNQSLAREQTEQFLSIFAQVAEHYGITVCWETLNASETNFGLSIVEDGEMIRRLKKRGGCNLGMVADLFHLIVGGSTPEDVEAIADLVCHVHIAQPPVTYRGFPTQKFRERYQVLLNPILKLGHIKTISIEAFNGTLQQDGEEALALLRQLCKEV